MRSLLVVLPAAGVTAAVLCVITAAPPAPAAPAPASQDPLVGQVNDAITRGKAYLRQHQVKGDWDVAKMGTIDYPNGGTVSLALLALLTCGVGQDDQDALKKGLEVLRGIRPQMNGGQIAAGDATQTYQVSLATMVYALAGHPEDQERIQENVNWLLAARVVGKDGRREGWTYGKPNGDVWDASNTQYALLALHEGVRSGAKVDKAALESIKKFYLENQQPDGGWCYKPGISPSMTMTTAGVCGLLITGMDLESGKQKLRDDGSAQNCGVYDEDTKVNQGLKWIGERFPASVPNVDEAGDRFGTHGPNGLVAIKAPFYGFYGIERTGRLTGQRFIRGHDWYRIGCKFLTKQGVQQADGSWQGDGIDGNPIVATCFALLFLAKGRTPVLMTKLAYGQKNDNDWNHKHNDLRNVVEFASRQLFKKQPMAWQIFDIRETGAENDAAIQDLAGQLLESPIVWFSGHDDVPSGNQVDLLKQYLENGGFVFAEACCGADAVPGDARGSVFDRKFRALMNQLYPDAKLAPLDPTHPIYTASGKFVSSDLKRFPLWGLQQGCKTLVVYSPKPISGYWEANDTTSEPGREAFELAANVIAYATGLEPPRQKGDSLKIADDASTPIKRGYLQAAQLIHGGEWKPAQKAMHNLMMEAQASGLDVILKTKDIGPADPNLADYRFLYIHGRGAFSFTPAEQDRLRFDLEENSALLFADACCGNKEFDGSFRKLMDELWAKAKDKPKLEPIPPDDELYGEALNGSKIDYVMCRRETADGKGVEPEFQKVKPALEGVKVNGRWVVIYSRYDIGCALEHHATPGCLGHDYPSAVALGRAAVLYALKR
jgi:hypothetical protein